MKIFAPLFALSRSVIKDIQLRRTARPAIVHNLTVRKCCVGIRLVSALEILIFGRAAYKAA